MTTGHYVPFPDTHWSLVRRAGFEEGTARKEALTTLLIRYEPALLSYLMIVRRMKADEARDLLQEFITDSVLEYELLRHIRQERGRFRTFLLTCLNRFAISRFRKAKTASNAVANAMANKGN